MMYSFLVRVGFLFVFEIFGKPVRYHFTELVICAFFFKKKLFRRGVCNVLENVCLRILS